MCVLCLFQFLLSKYYQLLIVRGILTPSACRCGLELPRKTAQAPGKSFTRRHGGGEAEPEQLQGVLRSGPLALRRPLELQQEDPLPPHPQQGTDTAVGARCQKRHRFSRTEETAC